MRYRLLIVVSGLVVFLATVAIRMRLDGTEPAPQQAVVTPQPAAGWMKTPATPGGARPIEAVGHAASARPPPPQAVSEPQLPEVPAALIVMPVQDGEKHAILRNMTGEPLLVTITVSSPAGSTKSTTEVALTTERSSKVDGLDTAPGDRITLTSSGYRDRTTFIY